MGEGSGCWWGQHFSVSIQVGCAMCQQTMQKHLLEFHEVRSKCDSSFTTKWPTWEEREGRKGP